jgi:hypothetical protein
MYHSDTRKLLATAMKKSGFVGVKETNRDTRTCAITFKAPDAAQATKLCSELRRQLKGWQSQGRHLFPMRNTLEYFFMPKTGGEWRAMVMVDCKNGTVHIS